MRRIFETARNNPLFQGMAFGDFEQVLNCLSAKSAAYAKGDAVLLSGGTVDFVGLVLSGSVQVIKEDVNGRIGILTELGVSELFGEVFACAGIAQSPVTVLAAENTEILRMDYRKIITSCTSACPFHAKLIENMLRLIARKSLMLNQKIEILSKRTTREKLLAFLTCKQGRRKHSPSPTTGKSWRTTCVWIAAQCQTSFVKCGMRGFFGSTKTLLKCCKSGLQNGETAYAFTPRHEKTRRSPSRRGINK